MRQIMCGDEKPDYSLRAGDLASPDDWDKAVELLGPMAKNDEDILMACIFPMQAKELLELRESGQLEKVHADIVAMGNGNSSKPAAAPAKPAEAPVKPAEAAPAAAPAASPGALLSAPGEFDAVLRGEKFHVLIAGVGEPPGPGGPIRYFIKVDGRLQEVDIR